MDIELDLYTPPCVKLAAGDRRPLAGKAAALLAIAALDPETPRPRAAAMLWPDSPEPQARNNLRTLAHRLSRQVGLELLSDGEKLGLAPGVGIRALHVPDILDALAVGGTRRCELLGDLGLGELFDFQAWLAGVRKRVLRDQLAELERACAANLARGDGPKAVAIARACVDLAPLDEHWYRQLMQVHSACGDRAAALAAYELCRSTLRDHVGQLPDDRTRDLHLEILKSQRSGRSVTQSVRTKSSVPLVERDHALAQMEQAHADERHIWLQGEAGVGRTRLLHEFLQGKKAESVTLRSAARHEPYAALAQVIQEVQERHDLVLSRSHRMALACVAPLAFPDVEPGSEAPSTVQLHAALRHWVHCLSAKGLRLLALDDLHNADEPSQDALLSLLRRRAGAQLDIQLLMSHRTHEIRPTLNRALEALQQRQHLRVVELPRLSERGVRALLISSGVAPDRATERAAALMQSTGGNPLFVLELMKDRSGGSAAEVPGTLGTPLEALLRSRLAVCSTRAQHLALLSGVAGAEFSLELAASIIGGTPLSLMPAWVELQSRGIFHLNGLAHGLLREAVLAMLPNVMKAALNRQVARHLEVVGRRGVDSSSHQSHASPSS